MDVLIRELLTYVTTSPALSEAKSFGHLFESISLIAREKRCARAWLPHRTECKSFISSHLNQALHFDSVLVLGSGPLHEIPMEMLARTFKKVVLVDIVHLKSTKESVKQFSNIEFVEHEISEIEAKLLKEKKLIEKIPERFLDENFGLVLSVNIMSQLPLHLNSYIKKKLKNKFSDSEVERFLQQVTSHHLQYLQKFTCPVLLITDIETDYYDKAEKLLQKDLNYSHLTLPAPEAQWIWNTAPIPEFDRDIAMKMKVAAFVLNKR